MLCFTSSPRKSSSPKSRSSPLVAAALDPAASVTAMPNPSQRVALIDSQIDHAFQCRIWLETTIGTQDLQCRHGIGGNRPSTVGVRRDTIDLLLLSSPMRSGLGSHGGGVDPIANGEDKEVTWTRVRRQKKRSGRRHRTGTGGGEGTLLPRHLEAQSPNAPHSHCILHRRRTGKACGGKHRPQLGMAQIRTEPHLHCHQQDVQAQVPCSRRFPLWHTPHR